MSALAPYRIVELAGERNQMAGFLFATLGAEVISVEPSGGSSARTCGPFLDDVRGADTSLWHLAYGRGKKSIALDVADPAQREELLALLQEADIFLESAGQSALQSIGLTYADIRDRCPHLVYVSISGFGNGPAAEGWTASDLAAFAASGALRPGGDPDRAPCRLSLDQAWLHTGAAAAGAALLALFERNRSGQGQHVDVSAQQVLTIAVGGWALAGPANAPQAVRAGGGVSAAGLNVRYVWPASDGFVSITHLFGPAFGPYTRRLMEWVHEAGFCDEALRDKDWIDYGRMLRDGEEPAAEFDRVRSAIEAFTSSRTKAELFEEGSRRRVLIAPVSTVADVRASTQLEARGYWESVELPVSATTLTYPGPWARLTGTPLAQLDSAPSVGQHSAEVRSRSGRRASLPLPDDTPPALPLSGVRVVDFSRAFAGPTVGRVLADFGATVVKIESATSMDAGRTVMPFQDNVPGVERSVLFSSLNAGKLGITLNMSRPEARELTREICAWSDVVIEAFSPPTMGGWGLSYADLSERNPGLIMLSTSLMGASGPLMKFAGYGNLAAALCGFTDLLGWPDRSPAGPFQAYTDFVAPHFMLVSILAALDHRRRTSQGQHIDLAQAEASLHFLTPALLDFAASGRVAVRQGNAHQGISPHGVYAAAGDDEWVTVVCADDAQWRALCAVMDRADLLARADLSTADGRVARRDEVDAAVESWTSGRVPDAIVERLQAEGISAHDVYTSARCAEDKKLAEREHFLTVDHPVLGPHVIEGPRYLLSRTPGRPTRGAPTLNEHLFEVLHDHLGYDMERISDLVAQGIFE